MKYGKFNERKVAETLQSLPNSALLAIAKGEIDIQTFGQLACAARGLDENGGHISIKASRRLWKITDVMMEEYRDLLDNYKH